MIKWLFRAFQGQTKIIFRSISQSVLRDFQEHFRTKFSALSRSISRSCLNTIKSISRRVKNHHVFKWVCSPGISILEVFRNLNASTVCFISVSQLKIFKNPKSHGKIESSTRRTHSSPGKHTLHPENTLLALTLGGGKGKWSFPRSPLTLGGGKGKWSFPRSPLTLGGGYSMFWWHISCLFLWPYFVWMRPRHRNSYVSVTCILSYYCGLILCECNHTIGIRMVWWNIIFPMDF